MDRKLIGEPKDFCPDYKHCLNSELPFHNCRMSMCSEYQEKIKKLFGLYRDPQLSSSA